MNSSASMTHKNLILSQLQRRETILILGLVLICIPTARAACTFLMVPFDAMVCEFKSLVSTYTHFLPLCGISEPANNLCSRNQSDKLRRVRCEPHLNLIIGISNFIIKQLNIKNSQPAAAIFFTRFCILS